MLPEPPRLPDQFSYDVVRQVLDDFHFRLLQSEMFLAPGLLMEFAGATAPQGWLEADGTEYDIVKFPDLFKVIAVESTPGKFVVPTAGAPSVGQIWIIKT